MHTQATAQGLPGRDTPTASSQKRRSSDKLSGWFGLHGEILELSYVAMVTRMETSTFQLMPDPAHSVLHKPVG